MTSTSYFFAQNKLGVATRTPRSSLDIVANDGIIFPVGTTAQRPVAPVTGTVRYNSDLSVLENYNGSYWDAVGSTTTYNNDAIPIGSILPHSSSISPAGFLLCDGSAVSRTTYNDLFSIIGTTYGSGDGSTTFNLPDLRGRFPLGAGTGSGLTARTLGASGGTESKTLAVAELPPHSHTSTGYLLQGSLTTGTTYDVSLGAGSSAYQDVTTSIGSGQSFSIMNPFLVTYYIIKAIIFNGSNYSWTNNGSQLVTLNNVGINVTNPSAKLEVSGNSILTGTTTIQGSLNLTNGSAILNSINISGLSTLNGSVTINNNLTITGTGTLNNISISGTSTFNNSLNITGALSINNSNVSTNTHSLTITSLSNLGIQLNSIQNAAGVNTGLYLNCINTSLSSNVQTNSSSITLKNGSGDRNLQFYNNSSNLITTTSIFAFLNSTGNYIMNMLNNGNIGIGTTNPLTPLDILGNTTLGNSDSTFLINLGHSGTLSGNLINTRSGFINGDGTNLYISNQQQNGAVILAANNTNRLKVTGTDRTALTAYGLLLSARDNDSSFEWYAGNETTRYGYMYHNGTDTTIMNQMNGMMVFGTNNVERMRINANGNIGIATTNPQQCLHVVCNNLNGNGTNGIITENAAAYDIGAKTTMQSLGSFASIGPTTLGNLLRFYWKSGGLYYRGEIGGSSYFTGQHVSWSENNSIPTTSELNNYIGLIVSSSGVYKTLDNNNPNIYENKEAITINNSHPIVKLSSSFKDPSVYGVITNRQDYGGASNDYDYDRQGQSGFENDDLKGRIRINSVGEGAIWVSNSNGNLNNGDYICSSNLLGYGEKQDDDLLHNYTVAKITCSVNFSDPNLSDKYQIRYLDSLTNIITYQQYQNNLLNNIPSYIACFVGCTYHCG